jgi:hypothetical protein
MSIDATRNPWVITSTGVVWGAAGAGAQAQPFPGSSAQPLPADIGQVEFTGYNAGTDYCVIEDLDGKVIWRGDGAADLETVRSGKIGWVHRGVQVTTLTAGSVIIYIR